MRWSSMQRDDGTFIIHILEAARKAVDFVFGRKPGDLEKDESRQDERNEPFFHRLHVFSILSPPAPQVKPKSPRSGLALAPGLAVL